MSDNIPLYFISSKIINQTSENADMIVFKECESIEPFGKEFLEYHPGNTCHSAHSRRSSISPASLGLLKDFHKFNLKEDNQSQQWRIQCEPVFPDDTCLSTVDDLIREEELYFKDKTVVWSSGRFVRKVISSFSMRSAVLQSFWCSFFISKGSNGDNIEVGNVHGIGIVERSAFSFYQKNGWHYNVSIPFTVEKAWPILSGVLIEYSHNIPEGFVAKDSAKRHPTLYSILHPLQEVVPVIKKHLNSSKITYVDNINWKIVHVSIDPSLIIVYDKKHNSHSVYLIRRCANEEVESALGFTEQTTIHQSSHITPSLSKLTLSSYSPSAFSPSSFFRSPNISKLSNSRISLSKTHSPSLLNRRQSPFSFNSRQRQHVIGSPNNNFLNVNETNNFQPTIDGYAVLQPNVCLDEMWIEKSSADEQEATKAFVTTDFCSQRFICLVISKHNIIKCIKIEENNDKIHFIIGTCSKITGFDAVNINCRKMMLVLEADGNLILYSGILKIGDVFLNGISSNIPLASSRRQSLVPMSLDADVDMELSPVKIINEMTDLNDSDMNILSPKGRILSFHSNVSDSVIIETAGCEYLRVIIPPLSENTLILKIIYALFYSLPYDIGLTFGQKWYAMKTFPGNENGRSQWNNFCFCIIETSLGMNCDTFFFQESEYGSKFSANSEKSKRQKTDNKANDNDWNFILDSVVHQQLDNECCNIFNLPEIELPQKETVSVSAENTNSIIDSTAFLLPYLGTAMHCLHILYNEILLDKFCNGYVKEFSKLLHFLAVQLNLTKYCEMYRLNEPSLWNTNFQSNLLPESVKLNALKQLPINPQNIMEWTLQILQNNHPPTSSPICYLPLQTKFIAYVVVIYCELMEPVINYQIYLRKLSAGNRIQIVSSCNDINIPSYIINKKSREKLILLFDHFGGNELKNRLPECILLPIFDAALIYKEFAPLDWPKTAYAVVNRPDLQQQSDFEYHFVEKTLTVDANELYGHKESGKIMDGMEFVDDDEALCLRFPNDKRTEEVRKLLCSSKPVLINIKPTDVSNSGNSETELNDRREEFLKSTLPRTMALSVGRGAFSLGTCRPLPTEPHPIPDLCLKGRVVRRQTTVELNERNEVKSRRIWPEFHNGVAAALSVGSSKHIDSTWILNYRPQGSVNEQLTPSHSGFLLGLGLGGHLEKCTEEMLHDYFCKQQELATIALILGYCAAKRGSQNELAIRIVALHLPALLVPTATQLDLPLNVQIASMIGIGLLFQGTCNSHMAKIMLNELNKPPGSELDNSGDLESYSLSAGFSLGLICLGKGNSNSNLYEILDSLHHYINGGKKRPYTGATQDLYKSPSVLVHEGDRVNVNITAPGALVAVALMFLKTHNKSALDLLPIPNTQKNLELIRPDILMLKIISRNLILWNNIVPTREWTLYNIPPIVLQARDKLYSGADLNDDMDYETMLQAYINILTGNLFCLSIKFAGSSNKLAAKLIITAMEEFIQYLNNSSHAKYLQLAGRYTIENVISILIVGLATIEAGSGDLEVLRYCRHTLLGFSTWQKNKQLYGSYMAGALATGFILLGAGRYTLGSTDQAVAALLISLFPKWPIHSSDNRYHLQALRHLYVLATERRILFTKHVNSNEFVTVPIEIRLHTSPNVLNLSAPCVLPPLEYIESLRLNTDRYWPIHFTGNNIIRLKHILAKSSTLLVKLKEGNLSHDQDPNDIASRQSLSNNSDVCKLIDINEISDLTSDRSVLKFVDLIFDKKSINSLEFSIVLHLSTALRQCLLQDKIEAFSKHCQLINDIVIQTELILHPSTCHRMKMILAWLQKQPENKNDTKTNNFFSWNFIKVLKQCIDKTLKFWIQSNKTIIKAYLKDNKINQILDNTTVRMLSCFVIWFDLQLIKNFNTNECNNKTEIIFMLIQKGLTKQNALILSEFL